MSSKKQIMPFLHKIIYFLFYDNSTYYQNFLEGFLKILIIIIPTMLGWLSVYFQNNGKGSRSFTISFITSVIILFIDSVLDYAYYHNKNSRFVVENILIMVVSAISFIFALKIQFKIGGSFYNNFKIPVILYFICLLPKGFELLHTTFIVDLKLKVQNESKTKKFNDELKIKLPKSLN